VCQDVRKFLSVSKIDNFNTHVNHIVIGKTEKKTVVQLAQHKLNFEDMHGVLKSPYRQHVRKYKLIILQFLDLVRPRFPELKNCPT